MVEGNWSAESLESEVCGGVRYAVGCAMIGQVVTAEAEDGWRGQEGAVI